LVVIKTQGVLKGYTGDHYPSHHVEDGILLGMLWASSHYLLFSL